LAFHLKDLRKIARRFGISRDDPLMDEELVLHTTMVQLCSTDNAVSRHVEKTIEKRFLTHSKKIPLEDPLHMVECLRKNPEELQAPLWAILWGLATRSHRADARLESSLFGFIHMLEHRLVRDHWKSLCSGENGDPRNRDKDSVILGLKRDVLDMQWANGKLEKIIGSLRSQIDATEITPSNLRNAPIGGGSSMDGCKCENGSKVRNLKGLLEQARYRNLELETENAQLKNEIDGLLGELSRYEKEARDAQSTVSDGVCPYAHGLIGKKVTLVGGIDSLEYHYRQIVESFGGRFCRHDGDCGGGEKGLHDCIFGADLVVCPVEVNSHNAAKSVKKICKSRGVRCYFPRSASITGLRNALKEHCSDQQVA